jgi:hypothetical protein
MNRVVDLDLKEKEWLQEIVERRELIAGLDKLIAEKQRQKQKAEEEITKFTEWISYAREITGVHVATIQSVSPSGVHSDVIDLGNLSLPRAIETLLRSFEGRKMKVGELRERLLNAGLKTGSQDFTNVLRNTLNRLVKRGNIRQAKDGYESLYYIGDQSDISSLPSHQKGDA